MLEVVLIFCLLFLIVITSFDNTVYFNGGKFLIGSRDKNSKNGDYPPYASSVKPFFIDKYPVTNNMWSQFIKQHPGYKTDAERRGWSYVFKGYLPKSIIAHGQNKDGKIDEPWMLPINMASWRQPRGPGSSWQNNGAHPVVHISMKDAQFYCNEQGMRLPSEHEWEFAARGYKTTVYPWGDHFTGGRINLWQGKFPVKDSKQDGWAGTSPVTYYGPQNEYGMFDMIGNVWEWTKTTWHERQDPQTIKENYIVLRGASHLDNQTRATTSSRFKKILFYSASNIGFRCAKSASNRDKDSKRKSRTRQRHNEL